MITQALLMTRLHYTAPHLLADPMLTQQARWGYFECTGSNPTLTSASVSGFERSAMVLVLCCWCGWRPVLRWHVDTCNLVLPTSQSKVLC